MTIRLSVLRHLGISLHSSTPDIVSKAVANSWDASAVHIETDDEDGTIAIIGNGCGISRDDINARYLNVGYAEPSTAEGNR